MTDIAFLGMGAMGARIATQLLSAGHSLHVWNRTPARCQPLVEQGATAYDSPKQAAEAAEVVIAMVANDEASRQVWLNGETGAMAGLQQGAIALEYSTLTLGWSCELARKMAAHSHPFLAAPVIGSRPQAEAGQLIQLVGGDAATLDAVQSILKNHSAVIHPVGDATASMALKLAINTLFGIQVAALGEVLGLLQKTGMSSEIAISWLNQMPTTSAALKGIGALMANQNYAPLFPINLVEKDFRYAQEFAQSLEANVPVVEAVRQIYQQAQKSGYGADNIAGIAQLYVR
ncbi:NAD(P)-dependent oxidoreductase [Leptothoe sp. PORK10 BA2]|uniref:NAD(P)-dependent oxidoreductase n=1 Tax=Leptothoe sp. PORK10 BA2 TaxID=3110254 RepID=UPI002B217E99|nr:NAD(P)-dependent oxidoreductase [Leptothoe sp. PORK10 BA2]MEA5464113.1 NAD(P)-dependent oxidoreductase [Leptothoe sp. PORK10 BA2]